MVTLTIDGMKVEAEEGQTLLEVARRIGVKIPTLCYHPALKPYGACRLCTVEVVKDGETNLVTACTYPVEEGIEVRTSSEKVMKARRIILELLLARCSKAEVIRELAREYGIEKSRFGEGEEDCILCGLCVRVCSEVIGANAISFTNRGVEREVGSPFEIDFGACIGCGACAFVCPTGAINLQDVTGERRIEKFNVTRPLVKCKICGSFFAPAAQIEHLKAKVNPPEEVLEVCPKCRRRLYATEVVALKHF